MFTAALRSARQGVAPRGVAAASRRFASNPVAESVSAATKPKPPPVGESGLPPPRPPPSSVAPIVAIVGASAIAGAVYYNYFMLAKEGETRAPVQTQPPLLKPPPSISTITAGKTVDETLGDLPANPSLFEQSIATSATSRGRSIRQDMQQQMESIVNELEHLRELPRSKDVDLQKAELKKEIKILNENMKKLEQDS
eukprot:jgi/Chlat1/5099/Chrsp33S05108